MRCLLKKIMRKILVITGTRAEYGLLSSTIEEIQKSDSLELHLLVTGMHMLPEYGMSIEDIKKDGVPIACEVPVDSSDDMLGALAKEIEGIRDYCKQVEPDLILVLGDRDEAFAGAIVGGHMNIPIAHIHGGDSTGFIVDGAIRSSITKFAHLHFVVCEKSRQNVLALGEEEEKVHLVGAPGIDILRNTTLPTRTEIAKELDLDEEKDWVLFLQHPTPFDPTPLEEQIKTPLGVLADEPELEKVVVYPNSDTGTDTFIEAIDAYKEDEAFHIFKNIPRHMYIGLMGEVAIMMGNSSSGVIESGYLKAPTINIGGRQLNRERGRNVVDVPNEIDVIKEAVAKVQTEEFKQVCEEEVSVYGDGTAGEQIVKILEEVDMESLFLKKDIYA
jgi:GDP/UDP-N,N'-diacetylbacillosamine 2-epimerase (hydrolysing)